MVKGLCHGKKREQIKGQEDVTEGIHNREPVEAETRVDREEHSRPNPKLLLVGEKFVQQLPKGAGGHPAHDQRENRPIDRGLTKNSHQQHIGVREERTVLGEIEHETLVT